jgi:hypothetical protein
MIVTKKVRKFILFLINQFLLKIKSKLIITLEELVNYYNLMCLDIKKEKFKVYQNNSSKPSIKRLI